MLVDARAYFLQDARIAFGGHSVVLAVLGQGNVLDLGANERNVDLIDYNFWVLVTQSFGPANHLPFQFHALAKGGSTTPAIGSFNSFDVRGSSPVIRIDELKKGLSMSWKVGSSSMQDKFRYLALGMTSGGNVGGGFNISAGVNVATPEWQPPRMVTGS